MTLHLSHIARYAPSIQSHIHLKTFAQILTIVFKQPLNTIQHIPDDANDKKTLRNPPTVSAPVRAFRTCLLYTSDAADEL